MGWLNCLKRLVARMSPCLRLAPTVPAGSRVARKYYPPLLWGNVRFAPIMCVPDASDTIRCVLWTALFVAVYVTLTDPLRIQPWSQDRRNQTKSNRKSEISRESRQKRTGKKVASQQRTSSR